MVALAVPDRAGLARVGSRAARTTRRRYTSRHAASCSTSAATRRPSCSSSSAPTRSPRSRRWRDYPAILDRAHFAVVSRPGLPGERHAAPAAGSSRTAWSRPPLDAIAAIDPLIILIDAPTADVSSTAIRRAPRATANRSPGWCRRRCEQHIEQHGLYTSTTPGRRASGRARGSQRQAGCMAKTERSAARSAALPAQIELAVARGRRQEGRRHRRARPAEGGGVHRLLPDLLGHQRAADARHRRRDHGGAGGRRRKPAHVEGYDRSEWILLDYFDFIVHIFAPETRMFYGLERLWGNAERVEIPPATLTGAPGRAPPATTSSPSSSRRPARRAERRSITPRAVRSAAPAGSRSFRSRRRSAIAAAIRCRTWRVARRADGALRALPPRPPRPSIARAADRRLRRRAARDRPRAEIRRPPLARAAAGGADARARRATSSRARTASSRCRSIRRGAGSAASIRRPICARHARLPVVPGAAARPRDADADRPARRPAPP